MAATARKSNRSFEIESRPFLPIRRTKAFTDASDVDSTAEFMNDDEAERYEKRRRTLPLADSSAEVSSPQEDSRAIPASLQGLSTQEINDHYACCMQLAMENKINPKNAFNLQLIDYMQMMLKNKDTKFENFTVLGCTLDASAKIYGCRVDNVYAMAMQIAAGISGVSRKARKANDVDEEGDEGEDGVAEGSKDGDEDAVYAPRRRKTRTRVENSKLIRKGCKMGSWADTPIKHEADSEAVMEPPVGLLQRLSATGPVSRHEDTDSLLKDLRQRVPLPLKVSRLAGFRIVRPQSLISFQWKTEHDNDDDNNKADTDHLLEANAFDEAAPVEQAMPHFDCAVVEDSDGENCRADSMSESELPMELEGTCANMAASINAPTKKPPLPPTITTILLREDNDFSYFDPKALLKYSRPSHWQLNRVQRKMVVKKEAKRREKQPKVLKFDSEALSSVEALYTNAGKITVLTQATLKAAWTSSRTYDMDTGFNPRSFNKYFLQNSMIVSNLESPTDPNVEIKSSTAGSPQQEFVLNGFGDDDCDDPFMDTESNDGYCSDVARQGCENTVKDTSLQHSDAERNATGLFAGDNLVAMPRRLWAAPENPWLNNIKHRNTDMEKLKETIWKLILDEAKKCKVENMPVKVKFSSCYKNIWHHLPLEQTQGLCFGETFFALLSLTNDNNLKLAEVVDFSDTVISFSDETVFAGSEKNIASRFNCESFVDINDENVVA